MIASSACAVLIVFPHHMTTFGGITEALTLTGIFPELLGSHLAKSPSCAGARQAAPRLRRTFDDDISCQ
jgi:hypothetical protein